MSPLLQTAGEPAMRKTPSLRDRFRDSFHYSDNYSDSADTRDVGSDVERIEIRAK
jgi:hypothetical protein